MRRRLALTCAVATVLACHPRGPGTPPDGGGPTVGPATAPGPVDRAALADAIDPGPQPALSKRLPAFMLDAIGIAQPIPDDADALVELALAELDAWEAGKSAGDLGQMLTLVIGLARGVTYAERAASLGARDPRVLGAIERLYHILDAPMVANDRAMFADMARMFVQTSIAKGAIKDAAQIEAISKVVFETVRVAAPAHRHAVAQLLRSDATDERVAEALWRAEEGVRREDDALGVRVARAAAGLASEDAAAKIWFGYAATCHRALELTCGKEALAKAESLAAAKPAGPDGEDGWKSTREYGHTLRQAAADAVAMRGKKDLASRNRQARALLELGRASEAEAAFVDLRADFPDEAAPVTGLAMHAVNTRLDLSGAAAIIDDAGPGLKHKDTEYYELSIGTRATRLIYDILPQAMAGRSFPEAYAAIAPMVATIRRDVAALDELGSSRAKVLKFLLDVALDEVAPHVLASDFESALPTLHGLLPRALALREQAPGEPLASRIVLAVAQFSPDAAQAFAAVRAPVPEGTADLKGRQIGALAELAVTWEDRAPLDEIMQQAQADAAKVATGPAQVQLGDAWALMARIGGQTDAWPKAEAAYRAGLEGLLGDQRERPLNNLGVAVAEQGRAAEARTLFAEAEAAGGSNANMVSVINRAALGASEEDLERLRERAGSGTAESRRLAAAWATRLGSAAQRRAATKVWRQVVAELASQELRPRNLPGAAGIVLAGTLNAGLGYSTKEGLTVDVTAASLVWLGVRPPEGLPVP